MFKKRLKPRLTPADLKRFGRRFREDMEDLLPGGHCRLVPTADLEAPFDENFAEAAWKQPLVHRGRPLGWLAGYLPEGEKLPPELEKIIPQIIRQALDKLWLYKAHLTDRETGLYNRDYFERQVSLAAKKWLNKKSAPLSLAANDGAESALALVELRQSDRRPAIADELAALARHLQKNISPQCLARIDSHHLGLIAEGRSTDLRFKFEKALDDFLVEAPRALPALGWVAYPCEWLPGAGSASANIPASSTGEPAATLWDKADTALFYARQQRNPAPVLAFSDLIEHYGQVVQLLPLDRVVINLGRNTGAAAGQVFLVKSAVAKTDAAPEYKGEVTVFETSDNYSIGHITSLKSAHRIVSGDHLVFSRQDWLKEKNETRPQAFPDQPLAGLPGKEQFIAELNKKLTPDRPLALALARLDGYEKTVTLMGQVEGERRLSFIYEKITAAFPETALEGRWRPDTLAFAWLDAEKTEVKPKAHQLVEELMKAGPLSLGMVFWPNEVVTPESLPGDAQKTLNEAAFSGQGHVTVFGPLALNISGDHFFEAGDWLGAEKEYERGLKLSPDRINLLNSLGVCRGRLGNFSGALEVFQKIMELEPDNMMSHYNLGYTYILAGQMEEAEKALSRAAEIAPENFETLFHLGKTALELGHLDLALSTLKQAAELKDRRPAVFRLLGEASLLAHDYAAALKALKRAVKADPNDAYALSALGALFVDQARDFEVACSLFQKSVEIDPTNSLYRLRLGRLLAAQGDPEEAKEHLNAALEYGGPTAEIYYQLGCLTKTQDLPEDAAVFFQEALKLDPDYAPAKEKLTDLKL